MAMSKNFEQYPKRVHEMKLAGGVEAFDNEMKSKSFNAGVSYRKDQELKYLPVLGLIIFGTGIGVTKGIELIRGRNKKKTEMLLTEAIQEKTNVTRNVKPDPLYLERLVHLEDYVSEVADNMENIKSYIIDGRIVEIFIDGYDESAEIVFKRKGTFNVCGSSNCADVAYEFASAVSDLLHGKTIDNNTVEHTDEKEKKIFDEKELVVEEEI